MPRQKPPDIGLATQHGLSFLATRQEADGSFVSFSSPTGRHFRAVRSWQTVFVPALMLGSLTGLDQPEALKIRNGLARFLLSQKKDTWSFNYWSKAAPEYVEQPYPDDLDDTFCALAGLYSHDSSLIDGAALAEIVKLLLATEDSIGGPYKTWLAPINSQAVWLDVDVAVNSNIEYFLSLASNPLPRLEEMIGQAIAGNDFSSPYYPFPYAFIYYFSRAYNGEYRNKLLRKARQLHKKAATDLDRALCLSARLRLDDQHDLSQEISAMLSGQRRDGSWPAAAFYADPVKDGKLYYNGAPALTTAFALEALCLYIRKDQISIGKPDKDITEIVLSMAQDQCGALDKSLRQAVLMSLERVASGDNGPEILDLPRRFYESLKKPPDTVSDECLTRLGLANLYGWLAYTIYDDFLDGEGKPELISVANIAMRRSLDGFSEALPSNTPFSSFVRQTFDTIDSANAWELANCRFTVRSGRYLQVGRLPRYGALGKLAERSLGHVLAPIAVMAAAGNTPDSAESETTLEAFRHYLIARQLNDDAHDWADDMRNGRISVVVVMLLKDLGIGGESGQYDLKSLLSETRQVFWHATLPKVCRKMRRHIRLARQALQRNGTLQSSNVIIDLLDGIEASVTDTLDQQRQAENFLKSYKRSGKKTTEA